MVIDQSGDRADNTLERKSFDEKRITFQLFGNKIMFAKEMLFGEIFDEQNTVP